MVRLRNVVMAVALGAGVMGCSFSHYSALSLRRVRRLSHAGVWSGILDDARDLHRSADAKFA